MLEDLIEPPERSTARSRLDRWLTLLRPEENVDEDPDGLICLYCGESGFESQEELENHLDDHPYLTRRDVRDRRE
ncbi:hypothetical protein [Halorhabdus rudnickae]|uniref:hypothetical protein n=1 Tax=Halorhabdus rudnickae TaxID=1775544 RepID=UPI0010838B59|nr:hypothetical protein [Halorhabdus rudnickae]